MTLNPRQGSKARGRGAEQELLCDNTRERTWSET